MLCLKYFTFILNLVFLVLGLLLLASGAVLQAVYKNYLSYLGEGLSIPLLLLFTGILISVLAWLGCWGSIREEATLTCLYTGLLTLIFSMEVVVGLVAYHAKYKLGGWLEERLVMGMQNFQKPGYGGVTETWNVIQHELGCCGVGDYKNWENTHLLQKASVPDSCCLSDVVGCGTGILKLNPDQAALRIHVGGCMTPVYGVFEENSVYLYTLIATVLFIQIFAIIFAICFGNTVKKGMEHV